VSILSQFVVFCVQLLAWLRLDEQSLLPPPELWMFLPLSCALLLCWLLPRVVVVLPTAPAPSGVSLPISLLLPQ
jgi:hypothetical protein